MLVFVLAVVSALGTRQWAGRNIWKNLRLMFALTMVWVGSEYLRGILFTGFPWNPLGVSQYANPALIQVAEWGGVHLVSACIVWMNAAIFITFRQYTHGDRVRKYRPPLTVRHGDWQDGPCHAGQQNRGTAANLNQRQPCLELLDPIALKTRPMTRARDNRR